MSPETVPAPEAIERDLSWGPVVRGLRWGSGQDRALFLHEPGADIDAWKTLPALVARSSTLTAIAVDLPGHGLSDDPWEPERLGEVIRELVGESTGAQFVVAAGVSALAALKIAAELGMGGLVCLSPDATLRPTLTPTPLPSRWERESDGEDQGRAGSKPTEAETVPKSPKVPKLFFAGSMAEDDLETARGLAASSGGWTIVTSVPVVERGTRLLASAWSARIEEAIITFFHDCQRRRRPRRGVLRAAHPEFA